jgi:hypothetical protein
LQNPAEVRLAQGDYMVDALVSDRSDQSFGEAVIRYVGRRCLTCSADLRGLFTLDVLVLGAEGHASIVSKFEVRPEAEDATSFMADLFRPPWRLEVENLFLRHQLNIALRGAPHRPRFRGSDRALLVWMTWLWPSLLGLSRVVQPDTILR